MLCEKCKNKKATLFYADEGGGRHSLCAGCAAVQGRTGHFSPADPPMEEPSYLPETLHTLLTSSSFSPILPSLSAKQASLLCNKCGTAYADILKGAPMGCSACYDLYYTSLPILPGTGERYGHRMPLRHRKRMEKELAVKALREEIKQAVAEENYELAATLRDKIKKLN